MKMSSSLPKILETGINVFISFVLEVFEKINQQKWRKNVLHNNQFIFKFIDFCKNNKNNLLNSLVSSILQA